jgi:hypothetical protein
LLFEWSSFGSTFACCTNHAVLIFRIKIRFLRYLLVNSHFSFRSSVIERPSKLNQESLFITPNSISPMTPTLMALLGATTAALTRAVTCRRLGRATLFFTALRMAVTANVEHGTLTVMQTLALKKFSIATQTTHKFVVPCRKLPSPSPFVCSIAWLHLRRLKQDSRRRQRLLPLSPPPPSSLHLFVRLLSLWRLRLP